MKLIVRDLDCNDSIEDLSSVKGGGPKSVRALPKIVKSVKRPVSSALGYPGLNLELVDLNPTPYALQGVSP